MAGRWGNAAMLAGMLGLAATAFWAARSWQATQPVYARQPGPAGCDLRAGACRAALPGGGAVSLAIAPPEIPLMQTLTLDVRLEGAEAHSVVVDIRGLNMDMGISRARMRDLGDGTWRGETILPVCSQRRMEWEAAVQVEGGARYEVPFPFQTLRP